MPPTCLVCAPLARVTLGPVSRSVEGRDANQVLCVAGEVLDLHHRLGEEEDLHFLRLVAAVCLPVVNLWGPAQGRVRLHQTQVWGERSSEIRLVNGASGLRCVGQWSGILSCDLDFGYHLPMDRPSPKVSPHSSTLCSKPMSNYSINVQEHFGNEIVQNGGRKGTGDNVSVSVWYTSMRT